MIKKIMCSGKSAFLDSHLFRIMIIKILYRHTFIYRTLLIWPRGFAGQTFSIISNDLAKISHHDV